MDNMFADLIPNKAAAPAAGGNMFADLIPNKAVTPSVGEDVTKSIGSNLLQGAASIPMIIPNLINGAATGPQMLYRGIRDTFQGNPIDNSPMWQPFFGSDDVVRAAGLDYQPKTIYGATAAIPSQVGGAMIGGVAANKMIANLPKFLTDQSSGSQLPPKPIPPSLGTNADLLVNGAPDVRTYTGEALGSQISSAEKAAKAAKTQAQKVAYQAAPNASTDISTAKQLGNDLHDLASSYDEDVVPAAKVIKKYAAEPMNSDVTEVPIQNYDNLRQRLNNIPIHDDVTAKLVGQAKKLVSDHLDNVFSNGLINGDQDAIALLKDSRAKTAYWRQNFTSNDANRVIKTFVENAGGPEAIAPEVLLDKFTNVGQAGLDAVKAAKSVLGNQVQPILKQGFINKIRAASLDANGNIDPAKLAKQITSITTKSPTLMGEVFSTDEQNALRAVQREALAYANGSKGNPGVLTKLTSKMPVIGPFVEESLKSRVNGQMSKDLMKAATGVKK